MEAETAKTEAKREADKLEKERIKKMAPEEQAKFQEKQRKREMKKQKGKLMKVSKAWHAVSHNLYQIHEKSTEIFQYI